jgi:thiamine pyrophosphate-dependent acetolactate synthase large subunit-like protein
MSNAPDGGEAIVEAFRNLGIDYVISSPGSEWAPVWEAMARQKSNGAAGPTYIDCGHENLAVDMAIGYTQMTGRMQAVLLHAGTGLLQGSMAIHGAMVTEVPMIVMSGEALSYGEDPEFEPGTQWYRNLSVVGGPQRLVGSLMKWANQATSIHTLYQSTIRAGEIAQRIPKGPTYLCMPMETMMAAWTPPERMRAIEVPAPPCAANAETERIAALIFDAKCPVITTEAAGRDPEAFKALVALAELMAIPVVEGRGATHANFPKDHPLYLGASGGTAMKDADLVIAVASRVPFYPPRNVPAKAKVVVVSDNPHKAFMVYQNLQADHYLEGHVASSLQRLAAVLSKAGATAARYDERHAHWQGEHKRMVAALRAAEAEVPQAGPIDPLLLCAALRAVMPDDTIYVDETVTYGSIVHQHLFWRSPQSFFRAPTGLGQGLAIGLGVKLAARDRPVVILTGDGSFLYNPGLAALGAAKANALPIMVVVFNNHAYKSMRRNHMEFYPQGIAKQTGIHYGAKVDSLDYSGLAALFDGFGRRVDEAADLQAALAEARDANRMGKVSIINVELAR